MSDLDTFIRNARQALAENNPKKALKILKPLRKTLVSTNNSNVILQQVFAEAYLEDGQLEKAYPLLSKACQLDFDGKIGGSEKFFTLGQVSGGQDGLDMLLQGIQNISEVAGDNLNQEESDMIVGGLLAMVEIWMTDLCMEPSAEERCEELITKAMEISEQKSPEAWSVLGSIRISQQRYLEASDAFSHSWEHFEIKKESIEKGLKSNNPSSHEEYVQLVQPLLSLMKMCIELGSYDVSLKIANQIKDIDEDNLEAHYLEGFTYYMITKLEMFKMQNPEKTVNIDNIFEFNQHFKELPLDINSEPLLESIQESRMALSLAFLLGKNGDPDDDVAQEIMTGTEELLNELGGPLSVQELMKAKKGEEDDQFDDINLETEIVED